MGKDNNLLTINQNGEFMYPGLNIHIAEKYKADTLLDNPFVPYLIMAFCAVVDASVFINLFKMISFDSPFMLSIETAGFVFAFDAIPLYLGIHLRRLRQGLSKDHFILWLALAVCLIACGMNTVLRLTTIDQTSPAAAASYYGLAVGESENSGIDSVAIALTIFGIGVPLLTSMGSFFISYLAYNPLKVRKRRAEKMLAVKRDEIRRLKAILSELDFDEWFVEHLEREDDGKLEEMKKMYRGLAVGYCEYVRQRLKEHLGNPAALNALSAETCISILERLDCELAALDKKCGKVEIVDPSNGIVDEEGCK